MEGGRGRAPNEGKYSSSSPERARGGGVVGMSLREFDGTPWRVVSQAPSGVQPGQGFLEVWTFEEPDQGGAVRKTNKVLDSEFASAHSVRQQEKAPAVLATPRGRG